MRPAEAIAEAHQLARAVREEAQAGEHTPIFLLMQLAAAVEQLAAAVEEHLSVCPAEQPQPQEAPRG